MSQDEGISEDLEEGIEWFSKWYHIPSVLVLFVFALWVRARSWGNFVVDGKVMFSGNDAWYHLRQVEYTVRHWPETMPFEVWTNFPTGTSVSQFGTIFDQVIATVALIVGLGSPDQTTIRMVHLFAPAVIGASIVVLAYFLGKRVGKGRFSGVVAALIVAFSTGGFLSRSLVGFSDHQVAEAFTQVLAVLAIVVALQVADREKPIWELVVDRDVAGLRKPAGYAALAGVATALYMWVWPPGVVLVGILGLYVTTQAVIDHLRGTSPEPMLLVGGVIFAVTATLMLLPLDTFGIAPVKFSLLQPGLALAGVVWVGFLAGLSRVLDERSESVWLYPLGVVGTLAVAFLSLLLLTPGVFDLITRQLVRVFGGVIGEQPTATAATVGEITPLRNPGDTLYNWYGFVYIIAIIGVVLAIARQTVASNKRSELLFVSLWLAVIFSMTYTQVRFGYYLTVPVAVMAAYAIGAGFNYLSTVARRSSTDIRPYQVMAVFTVLVLVMAPMVMATDDRGYRQDVVTQSNATFNGGPGGVQQWDGGLEWMAENTPAVGNFEDAGSDMNYWGEYAKTDDYEYDEGSYGVLSWWDYGHWITSEAERIPVANPFQQSASDAARFLLAPNESRADGELQDTMSDGENRDTRYVMIDWKMATASDPAFGTKFFAPPSFVDGVSTDDYYSRVATLRQDRDGNIVPARPYLIVHTQDYYETMVNRLYRYHGSAAWPDYVPGSGIGQLPPYAQYLGSQSPVPIVETESTEGIRTVRRDGNTTHFEPSLAAAESYLEDNPGAQIGGIGKFPSEHVSALDHYRLVHATEDRQNPLVAMQPTLGRAFTGVQQPQLFGERYSSWTKTFERVPGATVEGEIDGEFNDSQTVYASVNMRIPTTNQTFQYVQSAETDPDGSFTMTLPYSTTGYDSWGPEDGYTNVSVRAESSYTFTTGLSYDGANWTRYNTTEDVTEAQVIGEDSEPIDVTLEQSTIPTTNGTDNTNGNETDNTNGNETDGSENSTDNDTSSNLAAPDIGVEQIATVGIAE
ncbi:oligosaccharyl transferase, archaeosortase A system-associated [Halapricum hydrolyticum]|uniref:dolichyl-phosphooligosaccharide-protein glycotransferase n=1 Tax=Halapricum hydrolyticum TaxID=2979991 RepID=A0AAE3IDG9_9EURY|nr:oligosaccharyl transferase, archaeosortase A system-associated [Halapricum hydrolyticum]MCU4718447.1 oligosaccharyl transferase, archaeosortase A system-associated [Halapricum hydrolyticum]MCU4726440.1 oligosaccharyl transferase, archaeosortase A system-associated [Halapricum hydrolyticum]